MNWLHTARQQLSRRRFAAFFTIPSAGSGEITISALWYRRARNLCLASLALNLMLFWGLSRATEHRRADEALLNNIHFLAQKAEALTELYIQQVDDWSAAMQAYGASFTDPKKAETHLHHYNLAIDRIEERGTVIKDLGQAVQRHAGVIEATTRRTP